MGYGERWVIRVRGGPLPVVVLKNLAVTIHHLLVLFTGAAIAVASVVLLGACIRHAYCMRVVIIQPIPFFRCYSWVHPRGYDVR